MKQYNIPEAELLHNKLSKRFQAAGLPSPFRSPFDQERLQLHQTLADALGYEIFPQGAALALAIHHHIGDAPICHCRGADWVLRFEVLGSVDSVHRRRSRPIMEPYLPFQGPMYSP